MPAAQNLAPVFQGPGLARRTAAGKGWQGHEQYPLRNAIAGPIAPHRIRIRKYLPFFLS